MSQPRGAPHPYVSVNPCKGGRGEYAKYGKGARHQWFARNSIAPEQQLTETEQQIACKKARRGLARASCATLDDDPLYTNHVTAVYVRGVVVSLAHELSGLGSTRVVRFSARAKELSTQEAGEILVCSERVKLERAKVRHRRLYPLTTRLQLSPSA